MPIIILFSVLAALIVAWYIRKKVLASKRASIFMQDLPQQWIDIIETNVPLYRQVPSDLKNYLHGCIQLFLHEKEFVGRGINITQEIRLTIACNACMLLLHQHQRRFTNFKTIIIYPDTYVAEQASQHGSVEAVYDSHRAGESWVRGPIVLSWGDSIRGSLNSEDGHNVILHEFAHKLDEQTGNMNGLPELKENAHYAEWASVLNDEFAALKKRAQRGKNSVLDEYGTVSAAEFFAVATESFFEKPQQMKKKLPDLYNQLSRFYNIDPANWH